MGEIKEDFSFRIFFKIVVNNKKIGSARAYKENDPCYIGRLIVHPDFQNQGIGSKLMIKSESFFKNVNRFKSFTGYKSKNNLYLYKKLGNRPFKTEKSNENLYLTNLEKNIKN